ncbi:hypothetical protein ACQKWADRAFT_1911 [Trichoderma austrokoningii]
MSPFLIDFTLLLYVPAKSQQHQSYNMSIRGVASPRHTVHSTKLGAQPANTALYCLWGSASRTQRQSWFTHCRVGWYS